MNEQMIQELINELKASKVREKQQIEAMERNITKLSKVIMGNGERTGISDHIPGQFPGLHGTD